MAAPVLFQKVAAAIRINPGTGAVTAYAVCPVLTSYIPGLGSEQQEGFLNLLVCQVDSREMTKKPAQLMGFYIGS